MLKFRLWVLLGSILIMLVCRGFKDLAADPALDALPTSLGGAIPTQPGHAPPPEAGPDEF